MVRGAWGSPCTVIQNGGSARQSDCPVPLVHGGLAAEMEEDSGRGWTEQNLCRLRLGRHGHQVEDGGGLRGSQ